MSSMKFIAGVMGSIGLGLGISFASIDRNTEKYSFKNNNKNVVDNFEKSLTQKRSENIYTEQGIYFNEYENIIFT